MPQQTCGIFFVLVGKIVNRMKKFFALLIVGLSAFTINAQTPGMKAFNTKDGSIINHSTNLKIKNILINIDSTTSPKFACLNIEIAGITGSEFTEMASAKHTYTVFDAGNKPLPIQERVLKRVGGLIEEGIINYTIKLPFRLKTEKPGAYTINYTLESANGKKKINIISKAK